MDKKPENGRVELELEAMRSVVETLSVLPDEAARARVLRWAAEHLTLAQTASHSETTPRTHENKLPDSETADLNLEGLESLFEAETQVAETQAAAADRTAGTAADQAAQQARGKVTGFQRPARDRQSA